MTTNPLTELITHSDAIPQLQPQRHLIFCQGDEWNSVYIVKDGWVLIYELLQDGRRQVLKIAGPGSVLGYMPPGSRYMTCTGECLTSVVLSVIPRRHFAQIVHDRPDLAIWLAGVLATDLEAAYRRLTIVGRCTAREKVAYLLAELACLSRSTIHGQSNDGSILLLPVKRLQIGDALGLSTEHICRVFRGFKDEGLIRAHNNRISVLNLQKLAEIAGMDIETVDLHMPTPDASVVHALRA